MTKKSHQKILVDKRHFFQEKFAFFRKSAIFSRNFPKTYRNLTLGFLGFFYCPILGFQFLLSGNTDPNMVPKFTDIPQHRSLGLKGQIPASQVRPTSIRENSYAVYLAILQRLINSYRDYL